MKTTPLITLDGVPYYNRQDKQFRDLSQPIGPSIVTQDYTFRDNDNIDSLQVDATAGNITITLPSPTGNRRRRVIKTDSSANTVTVAGTINGVTNYILPFQYNVLAVEPTGTNWLITNLAINYPGNSWVRFLSNTASLNFPNIAPGGNTTLTISVPGAVVGSQVIVTNTDSGGPYNLLLDSWVSAADTVTVKASNYTAGNIDAAAQTYRVTVLLF